MARSRTGEWLLLENGNWIAAFQVSTQGFDDTYKSRTQEGPSVPHFPKDLGIGEETEPSVKILALRQQAYDYVNEARTSQGLAPVRLGDNQAAQQQAADMIMNRYLPA